ESIARCANPAKGRPDVLLRAAATGKSPRPGIDPVAEHPDPWRHQASMGSCRRPAPSDVQPANAESYGAPCPAPRRARRCAVAQEMCGLPAWTKLSNVRMCLSRLEKPVGLPFG